MKNLKDNEVDTLSSEAITLLQELIATPSFSKEEDKTAKIIGNFLRQKKINANRYFNNIWAVNKYFDEKKYTVLLNSHHDTVTPNAGYTIDPFEAIEKDGKLFGLGSNDAGGCLVALIQTFIHFYNQKDLPFNLILAATAEEEISGCNGIEILLPMLPKIDCGIVGEPTLMQMAVAEKGLLVLDCKATGVAGHAARNEGVNAIYKAVKDISWLSSFKFEKASTFLGPVHIAVTSIASQNKAHNVVPAECSFVIDIRVNECYTFEEIIQTIQENISSTISPRSIRLQSSFIADNHPLVKAGKKMGLKSYGSPTCSDRALMKFPTLKIGPGDSSRSHSADEFIFLNEIKEGVGMYIQLLKNLSDERDQL